MGWIQGSALVALFVIVCVGLHLVRRSIKAPLRSSVIPPDLYVADASLGYTNRPSLFVTCPFGSGQSFGVRTDSLGLRQSMYSVPAEPPASGAILFLGDSQTFGTGIEHEETFSAVIGQSLGVPALNAGVAGYGTASILRMAERHAVLQPRAIVVLHVSGHTQRAANQCYPGFQFRCLQVPHARILGGRVVVAEPDEAANRAVLEQHREYVRYVGGTGAAHSVLADLKWRTLHDLAHSPLAGVFLFRRHIPDAAARALIAQNLYENLRRTADTVAASLLVAYLPDYLADHLPEMPAYLKEVFHELGIPYVDLRGDILAAMHGDPIRVRVPNDGHLNAVGHAVIAARLVPVLRQILRHPLVGG